MATGISVNIGSGNGLVPNGTKPLSEPMLAYYQSNSSEQIAIFNQNRIIFIQ